MFLPSIFFKYLIYSIELSLPSIAAAVAGSCFWFFFVEINVAPCSRVESSFCTVLSHLLLLLLQLSIKIWWWRLLTVRSLIAWQSYPGGNHGCISADSLLLSSGCPLRLQYTIPIPAQLSPSGTFSSNILEVLGSDLALPHSVLHLGSRL